MIRVVLAHPRLWGPAVRAVWRLRRTGGLTPSRDWWRWRLQTAYGTSDRRPDTADLVSWLEWCRVFENSR